MLPNHTLSLPLTSYTPTPPEAAAAAVDFDYHAAMIAIRSRVLQTLTDSKMPTNLKQRYIEQEILKESVELALSSAVMRQAVIAALLENVDKGPGHLSVHRAKRALKEIYARTGLKFLSQLLQSDDYADRYDAAELLGWSKNSSAIRVLLRASETTDHQTRDLILSVLHKHYPSLGAVCWPAKEAFMLAQDSSAWRQTSPKTALEGSPAIQHKGSRGDGNPL